jgi:putative ATPase
LPPSAPCFRASPISRKPSPRRVGTRRLGQRTLAVRGRDPPLQPRQQDGFLPFVEDGTVTLVGATTENPSFELNAALLSRAQVLILHRLDAARWRAAGTAEALRAARCR